MLSEEAKQTLLNVARQSVEAAIKNGPVPKFDIADEELNQGQGAFVTLKTQGQLRGCIGRFMATEPLWTVVREMASASATRDVRFIGVQLRPEEFPILRIEISVLSPLQRISNPAEEVELGKHGIYIKQGTRSGCFLPQVATETGWTKEEFLSNCCAGKAGLLPDAWQDPQTEVYVFSAEVFGEED